MGTKVLFIPIMGLDLFPIRTGHTVTLEPPSSINENRRIIYLVGGVTETGISDEVWYANLMCL